ncbi:competence protein CoiA family protein [Flammeovirga kamogawensis]|uniref:Competence protein CoiA-like N-terminal domain-containing protein n=1 Tax=Flammeovirga kamogawensis TaxID=373891 RepID=A0ABX8H511_9BACT|nr:competence protein CoiA family protein [Flammeovirga kamogawensis]MBB6463883.1 hypothetical protein [Flammeovirga kamogawensis]QWG10804.1 hypothetical protein KM029_26730 [Flammeovirga kamogawensis]TRX63209.1 hypothetical protein EO216_26500 [Flammeovirga kamogawensis]
MITIKYAFDTTIKKLISIEEADKSHSFICNNCRQTLIPKRGRVKESHFAHKDKGTSCISITGETPAGSPTMIEMYKKFISQTKPVYKGGFNTFRSYVQFSKSYIPSSIELYQGIQLVLKEDEAIAKEVKSVFKHFQKANKLSRTKKNDDLIKSFNAVIKKNDNERIIGTFNDFVKEFHYTKGHFKYEKFDHKVLLIKKSVHWLPNVVDIDEDDKQIFIYHDNKPLPSNFYPLYQKTIAYQKNFDKAEKYFLDDVENKLQYLQNLDAKKLYFIQVIADGSTFHKIGITGRDFRSREKEIKADLKHYFNKIEISPIYIINKKSYLEYFFKMQFKQYNITAFDAKTEYFSFPDHILELISKQLKPLSSSSKRVATLEKNKTTVGRKKIEENDFISSQRTKDIISYTAFGMSVRDIAKSLNTSVQTVTKTKNLYIKQKGPLPFNYKKDELYQLIDSICLKFMQHDKKHYDLASSVILQKYQVEKLVTLFLKLVSKESVALSKEEGTFVLFISTVCSD